MSAQDFTQSRMNQVGRRVIAPRRVTLFDIDFGSDRIANFQGSFFDCDLVDDKALRRRMSIDNLRNESGTRILRVIHGRDARATFATTFRSEVSTARGSGWVPHADQLTYVTNLATALGIERSLI